MEAIHHPPRLRGLERVAYAERLTDTYCRWAAVYAVTADTPPDRLAPGFHGYVIDGQTDRRVRHGHGIVTVAYILNTPEEVEEWRERVDAGSGIHWAKESNDVL